ncbi:hypothetical protein BGZ47_000856 [Haplosporangium gracile]|nr:hypothetical protein BGZ47_000856 [Haplosporangium gracile]
MASINNTEDSDHVQLMQHIPMVHLTSAGRPIYRISPSYDDEGSPYVRMQDVYVVFQYPGDILIFKDECQQYPVLIQGLTDGNPGWIPYYPNRTLYFRRSNQEVEPNSPTLPPPPPPARSRLVSTRVHPSRRGSPPPLPPRVGSPSLHPPESGSYGVRPSCTKSPRLTPTRSSAGGAISFRIASPPRSSSSSTPYARSSPAGRFSDARRTAGSHQCQQSSQHTEQPQSDETPSAPAISLAASSPTAAGSHDSATSSSAGGSDHGSPGSSAPVARQSQRGSQCDDELTGMISLAEEQLNDSRAREEQSICTVSQFLDESAYLNQHNYDLQQQIHGLQQDNQNLLQDNQVLYQDNQALQQDNRSFRQANQNLAQEIQALHQEIQAIHQNYGDLQNLNHLREQEICELKSQNVHLRHREGTFVCIICSQSQQGRSGAASSSSSPSPSRSLNPRGPSSLRRLVPAPPQNPQALAYSEGTSWRHFRGPLAPQQRGQALLHQENGTGLLSDTPYIESYILGTSPTLPPPAVEGFDENPTATAASTLVLVSQSQGQVLNEQDRHAAHGSPSSQSPSVVATAMVADFVERDIMYPYNSSTLDYRVHDWVQEANEGNPSNEDGSTPDTEDEEVGQEEDEEVEEEKDYEVEDYEVEEGKNNEDEQ